MAHGYYGKILHVNLTTGDLTDQPLSEGLARLYLGGSGLAAHYLHVHTNVHTDPLGDENPLCFMAGPFVGSPVPASNRFAVAALSPLTGIWGESDCGGRWGGALKSAGYDGIVVTGRSASPVYLWVEDNRAELRDASHLWGLDTYELDLGAEMVCIGPAGEKGVRFASVMSGRRDGRAAGRSGLGAVMGSKQLKAIACRGQQRPSMADREALLQSVREVIPAIRQGTAGMHNYGTANGLVTFERMGDMPIRNWAVGQWTEGAERISGQHMADTILTGTYACGGCPIGCGRMVEISQGPYAGVKGAGPEYETCASMGALCLIDDIEAVAKLNELCNRLGMDTISAGAAIAFAMEARERGLIDEGPDWGDAQGAIELLERIADQNDALAQLLGQGVRAAASRLGGEAEEFAIHVKGMELPMHDPRAFYSLAPGYATSNRGACHLQALSHIFARTVTMPEIGVHEVLDRHAVEGKGALTARAQDLMCLFDSLKQCKFVMFGGVKLTHMTEWLQAITGWDVDNDEMLRIGERISNLKRMINVRRGISRKDDTLPPRILVQRFHQGGAAGRLPPLGEMLADYYEARGWTAEGVPTPEKLAELGLSG